MDICERFLNDTEDRCLQIARQTSEIIRDFAKSMSLSLRSLNPSRNKRRTDANPTSSSKGGCSRCEMVRALFGDQRVYASHKSIMFSRKSYYFFVRPKRNFLEICVFLGRTLKAPQSTGRQSPRLYTLFTSSTGMKCRHPLLTGFEKPTIFLTCLCQRRARRVSNQSTSRSPAGFPFDRA